MGDLTSRLTFNFLHQAHCPQDCSCGFVTVGFLILQHKTLPISYKYQLVSHWDFKQMWNCGFPTIFDITWEYLWN